MKKLLNEEHQGFAITLEVMAALFMFTMFTTVILYTIRVMNTDRYMNTILTSTAASASRWGGTNTAAYARNVNSTQNLLTLANQQLAIVAPDYHAQITGGPGTISYDNQLITLTLTYYLPPIFGDTGGMGRVTSLNSTTSPWQQLMGPRSRSISVKSIMNSGILL